MPVALLCRACGEATVPIALGERACAVCLEDERDCTCTPRGTVEGCGCDACRSIRFQIQEEAHDTTR